MPSAPRPLPGRAFLITMLAAGGLSACQSAYFGNNEPRYAPPPQPLPSAPVGAVTQSDLPPPGGMSSDPLIAGNQDPYSTTPPPPGSAAPGGNTQMAAVPPGSGGEAIGRTDLLGGWTVASGGESCQLFMSLTSWSGGYRASTRGCGSPALQNVSAWNLSGNQVSLLDQSGSPVARLYPSSKTQFNGQTESGATISVTR